MEIFGRIKTNKEMKKPDRLSKEQKIHENINLAALNIIIIFLLTIPVVGYKYLQEKYIFVIILCVIIGTIYYFMENK